MKRIIIALTLLVMTFNTFALELSELRKSKNMEYSKVLELLDDETEEVEKEFDWLVIPEIDTTEPELPNNEYFDEKEKDLLGKSPYDVLSQEDIIKKIYDRLK